MAYVPSSDPYDHGRIVTVNPTTQRYVGLAPADPIYVEDAGTHTNPEKYLHDNHWGTVAEIPIVAAGAGGQLNLGAAVGAGVVRRIREVTVRHAGSANTVVTIYDANGGNILLTIDIPAQTTRTWSSQDGRLVAATLQPVIRTSDVVGGSTFVSAAGVEAIQS